MLKIYFSIKGNRNRQLGNKNYKLYWVHKLVNQGFGIGTISSTAIIFWIWAWRLYRIWQSTPSGRIPLYSQKCVWWTFKGLLTILLSVFPLKFRKRWKKDLFKCNVSDQFSIFIYFYKLLVFNNSDSSSSFSLIQIIFITYFISLVIMRPSSLKKYYVNVYFYECFSNLHFVLFFYLSVNNFSIRNNILIINFRKGVVFGRHFYLINALRRLFFKNFILVSFHNREKP